MKRNYVFRNDNTLKDEVFINNDNLEDEVVMFNKDRCLELIDEIDIQLFHTSGRGRFGIIRNLLHELELEIDKY